MEINSEFILYVSDQKNSRDFYSKVLNMEPGLDVEGMTEFQLSGRTKLGLMPYAGIRKILEKYTPDPGSAAGIPRCELYLLSENAAEYCSRALAAGAIEISPLKIRDWGDSAAYYSDPDGHIVVFAEKLFTDQK
ncbi:MAG TPA: hypothetical protein PKE39_04695 [Ignavibacteria bacterium]|nr:hypothetical protein [Ignavibacteria bacterium]HMQ98301.1 hypothetical protein [Ignavibacteria bacterium]